MKKIFYMNVYEFHLSIEIVVMGPTKFVFGMVLSSVFLDLVFCSFWRGVLKFNFGFCTVVKFEVQFILVWYIINWKWEKTHRIRMVFFKRYKPHRYSRSSTVVHTAEANSTQFAIFETIYPLFIENRHIVSMHVYLYMSLKAPYSPIHFRHYCNLRLPCLRRLC